MPNFVSYPTLFPWCLSFLTNRIWDLSLERDEEEETEFKAKLKEQASAPQDLPPQLLFVHQVPNSIALLYTCTDVHIAKTIRDLIVSSVPMDRVKRT